MLRAIRNTRHRNMRIMRPFLIRIQQRRPIRQTGRLPLTRVTTSRRVINQIQKIRHLTIRRQVRLRRLKTLRVMRRSIRTVTQMMMSTIPINISSNNHRHIMFINVSNIMTFQRRRIRRVILQKSMVMRHHLNSTRLIKSILRQRTPRPLNNSSFSNNLRSLRITFLLARALTFSRNLITRHIPNNNNPHDITST